MSSRILGDSSQHSVFDTTLRVAQWSTTPLLALGSNPGFVVSTNLMVARLRWRTQLGSHMPGQTIGARPVETPLTSSASYATRFHTLTLAPCHLSFCTFVFAVCCIRPLVDHRKKRVDSWLNFFLRQYIQIELNTFFGPKRPLSHRRLIQKPHFNWTIRRSVPIFSLQGIIK